MAHFFAQKAPKAIARLHTTKFQETYIHFGLIKQDPDDNKFVDCAVAAVADMVLMLNEACRCCVSETIKTYC